MTEQRCKKRLSDVWAKALVLAIVLLLFGSFSGGVPGQAPPAPPSLCERKDIEKIAVSPDDFKEYEIGETVKVEIEIYRYPGNNCTITASQLKLTNAYDGVQLAGVSFNQRMNGAIPIPNQYETSFIPPANYYRFSIYHVDKRISSSHIDFFVTKRQDNVGDNGIYVLPPKIYDERSLVEKLQELESILAGKLFIDQTKISGAVGTLQGATQDVSTLGVQVSTVPLPGITDTVASGSNTSVSPTGTTTTTTSSSNTATNTAPVSATIPSLPSQTPGVNPAMSFGQSGSNLLAEQMQLSYEIINIRTLLERAISDRVDVRNGNPRSLAVLGFRISIDSQKQYQNAVAEVKVRIKNLIGKKASAPNIVSLIPQEKTYNVATVTKNAKQFGFGAVIQPISLGVSVSRSRDTFYLVRDTDTVAMEGSPYLETEDGKKKVSFSWQFRPVLGRKIVQPGTRNVFALLSLPPNELENGEDTHYVADIEVQTIWRKYNAKKGLIGEQVGETSTQHFQELVVPQYAKDFSVPKINNIKWEDAGNGQALVIVEGSKFVKGTEIIVGNTVLNTDNKGISSRDEDSLRFSVPISMLGTLSNIFLSSRFGSPRPLRRDLSDDDGIRISGKPMLSAIDAKTTKVTIYVTAKTCKNVTDPSGNVLYLSCLPSFYSEKEKERAEQIGHNTFGNKELVKEAFNRNRLNKPLVIVGNQVFGSAAAPVKIEEFTKLAKQVEGIFPTEDEERDLKKSLEATLGRKSTTAEFDVVLIANGFSTRTKALKITVAVPTQLLSDTGSVIVKYPFLDPEKFIAESDVEFQESFGATGIQILSSTDKTVQLLISGRKFERPEILINGAKYSVCAPAPPPCVSALKLLGKKLLLLELPFGLTGLSTIGSLIVSQEDKFVILPIDQKPLASLKPEFHQLPVINLGDSKTFIFKGANLGSIQEIRFEGNALRFQIKDDGATLLVDFTTDVTQFIGFKKLIYTLKDGKSDSLEIKIN